MLKKSITSKLLEKRQAEDRVNPSSEGILDGKTGQRLSFNSAGVEVTQVSNLNGDFC